MAVRKAVLGEAAANTHTRAMVSTYTPTQLTNTNLWQPSHTIHVTETLLSTVNDTYTTPLDARVLKAMFIAGDAIVEANPSNLTCLGA